MNMFTVENGRKVLKGTSITVNVVEPEIDAVLSKSIVVDAEAVSFSHREGYLWVVAVKGRGGKIVSMGTDTSVEVYSSGSKVLTIHYKDLESFNPEEIYV